MDLLSCRDRWGRTIVLTDRAWSHILDDHGEMAGNEWAIDLALRQPDYVMDDASVDGRLVYYRGNVLPKPFDASFVKVCVELLPPDETGNVVGEIVTAYATPSLKRGERQRWP